MFYPDPNETVQVHGVFAGADLDWSQCERLSQRWIDPALFNGEEKCISRKWFDYRILHPWTATCLLAHHYQRACGDFLATCRDQRMRDMLLVTPWDAMATSGRASIWRLRQEVDQLGLRYEFFWREVMNWAIEQGWRVPPRPGFVLTHADLLIRTANRWEMESRARIQWARSPHYTVARFVGSADQIAYEAHLVERILQRPHPKFALHAALFLHQCLRMEMAHACFSPEVVRDACAYAQTFISHD